MWWSGTHRGLKRVRSLPTDENCSGAIAPPQFSSVCRDPRRREKGSFDDFQRLKIALSARKWSEIIENNAKKNRVRRMFNPPLVCDYKDMHERSLYKEYTVLENESCCASAARDNSFGLSHYVPLRNPHPFARTSTVYILIITQLDLPLQVPRSRAGVVRA